MNFFKIRHTAGHIHPIDLYPKSDVDWNSPSLIDYWLITNTPLILALFLWFLDIISKSVGWIFFIFCTYMHLGTIHLWYKYHVDWIISSLINNQSIDWKFTKNVNICTKCLIYQELSDEICCYLTYDGIYVRSTPT